jgi:quercetin dioxygenase-like cupin family protein
MITIATLRAVSRTGPRLAAAMGLAALLLTGCAQPGQLGSAPEPVPAPLPAPPPAPAPPAGPVLVATGRVEDRVTMRTTGPAAYSVRTVVLQPGESTEWHRHPGTELSIVQSGQVTVLREDDCDPARYSRGDGVFIADGQPHLMRNGGTVPAELVVTHLLDPGAPGQSDVPPAC